MQNCKTPEESWIHVYKYKIMDLKMTHRDQSRVTSWTMGRWHSLAGLEASSNRWSFYSSRKERTEGNEAKCQQASNWVLETQLLVILFSILSIHLFSPQVFIKHLLYTRPHSRCWGHSCEGDQSLDLLELTLAKQVDDKPMSKMDRIVRWRWEKIKQGRCQEKGTEVFEWENLGGKGT